MRGLCACNHVCTDPEVGNYVSLMSLRLAPARLTLFSMWADWVSSLLERSAIAFFFRCWQPVVGVTYRAECFGAKIYFSVCVYKYLEVTRTIILLLLLGIFELFVEIFELMYVKRILV